MIINEDTTINVGISIGLADSDLNENIDFESMLKKADEAMYAVKQHGKNGYCIKNAKGEMFPKLLKAGFQSENQR